MFLDDVRIGYNSYTQTLDVKIMPTFIHDSHQPWLVKEIMRMVATRFITFAEFELLEILCGTSKCPYFLFRFFSTDLGQLLKLLDHPIPLRPKNQISASV
jgi:hypothetical protein